MNGLAAVPDQDFLRLRFLLRRPNPHPDQQPLIFGSRLQAPYAIAVEAAIYDWQRDAAYNQSTLQNQEIAPAESGLIS